MERDKRTKLLIIAAALFCLCMAAKEAGIIEGGGGGGTVDKLTYAHERDVAPVPADVIRAFRDINANKELGIVATVYEIDQTDGDDDIPDQYKVSRAEQKKVGGPVIVVESGGKAVLNVVPPVTYEAIMELVD